MNGIEKITQRIEADAQAEIDRILSEAREEADQITGRYKAQAEAEAASLAARNQAQAKEEAAELSAKNQKAAAEREERLVSVAQMEARKVQLAAKQEMVEKAYDLALEKLCAMPDARYTEVLAGLLVQASSNGREEAIFSPEDRERVGKAAVDKANAASGKQLKLSKETRPLKGGFVLRDENIEVNCTFDTLVRLEKAETTGAVVKKLFPEA